jgi:hypothetical protein
MPTYLVESYQPKGGASPKAVAALLGQAPDTRHRWSLLLPEEDICFHLLDAPSAEGVRDAAARARLRCQRVSEVVLLPADQLEIEGGSA